MTASTIATTMRTVLSTIYIGARSHVHARWSCTFLFIRSEEFFACIAQYFGEYTVGKLLDACVKYCYGIVIAFSSVCDGLLEFRDTFLKLHEILVCFEFWIVFDDAEELAECLMDERTGLRFVRYTLCIDVIC